MVKQWIGTKITDYSSSMPNFVSKTIKDEFYFDEEFYKNLVDKTFNSTELVPHVYIRAGTKGAANWINLDKKYERIEVKFYKEFSGYSEGIEFYALDAKNFESIKLENECQMHENSENIENEYGSLEMKFIAYYTTYSLSGIGQTTPDKRSSMNLSGLGEALTPTKQKYKTFSCKISLSEAYKQNGVSSDWPIFNDASEKVGSISLVFHFRNQKLPTNKDILSSLVNEKLLEELSNLIQRAYHHTANQEIINNGDISGGLNPQFDAYDSTSELLLDIAYFIEISSEKKKRRTKSLELYYNNQKVGSIGDQLHECSIKCPPIKSVTNDIIKIRYMEDEIKHASKDVPIKSISWKSGLDIELQNTKLRFEFRATSKPPASPDGETSVIAKTLLRIIYFDELSSAHTNGELSNWNGLQGREAKNTFSILSPYFTQTEWKSIKARIVLGMKLLFPELTGKVVYQSLDDYQKIGMEAKDENRFKQVMGFNWNSGNDLLGFFKNLFIQTICRYHANGTQEKKDTEEFNYIIDSLQLIYQYDNSQIKEDLMRSFTYEIQEKIRKSLNHEPNVLKYLQDLISLINSYDQDLQDVNSQYGNFAIEVWCPVLASSVIKNMLPRIKECLTRIKSMEHHDNKVKTENTLQIYLKLKSLIRFGQPSDFEEVEQSFFKLFEPWLPHWLDDIETEAKTRISKAVAEHIVDQSSSFNTKYRKGSERSIHYSRSQSLDLSDYLDAIKGAKGVVDIFQTIIRPTGLGIKPWKDIFLPYHKKGEHGFPFLTMLHKLFLFYVDELTNGVQEDNEFEPLELAHMAMSIHHVKYQYLNDFYQNEIVKSNSDNDGSYKMKVDEMKCEVKKKMYCVFDLFCKYQMKCFQDILSYEKRTNITSEEYSKRTHRDETINNRIEYILNVFRKNWDTYFNVNANHVDSVATETSMLEYLRLKLFEIEEKVLEEHFNELQRSRKTSMDTEKHKEVKDNIEASWITRQNENIPESESLKILHEQTAMKSANSLELISKHLTFLHNQTKSSNQENGGSIGCIIGKVGNKVCVHLKNAVLHPREEKDTCNFQIKVSLLPIQNEKDTFCIKKSSEIYEEKTTVFFDNEYLNSNRHIFDFDLVEDAGVTYKDRVTQFIELNLYDISSLAVRKYFRGHALFPIDEDIPTFLTKEEFENYCRMGALVDGKFAFSESLDSGINTKCKVPGAYKELKLREENTEDDIAKAYIKHRRRQIKNKTKSTATQ